MRGLFIKGERSVEIKDVDRPALDGHNDILVEVGDKLSQAHHAHQTTRFTRLHRTLPTVSHSSVVPVNLAIAWEVTMRVLSLNQNQTVLKSVTESVVWCLATTHPTKAHLLNI